MNKDDAAPGAVSIRTYFRNVSRQIDILNNSRYKFFSQKQIHLYNFFEAITPHYHLRQQMIREYIPGSNQVIPQFDVSLDLMPDIFSYSGYDKTALMRDQEKKNEIVIGMLDESLAEDPAVVIDFGTYDGKRTKKIISSLKNKKNIIHLVGIDTNPAVKDAFRGFDVSNSIVNINARNVLSQIGSVPAKKIYLGLENVMMNMSKLGGCDHVSFNGLLNNILTMPGDELIFETSNVYNPDNYAQEVEDMFVNYFEKTGLKDLIGGTLIARTFDRTQKAILIDEIKEHVNFEGMQYHFSRPKLLIKPNFGDDMMETDAFSQPIICLGISQSLPRDEVFSVLLHAYIQDIMLLRERDWQFTDNQSVAKLTYVPNNRVSDDHLSRILENTLRQTLSKRLTPLFGSFTDVLLGTGVYPSFYNKFLTKYDYILGNDSDLFNPQPDFDYDDPAFFQNAQSSISSPVKYFLSKRAGNTSLAIQENMNVYIKNYLAGLVGPVKYDPLNGMNIKFESLFNIKMPPR